MTNALEQNIIKFIAENKLISSVDKLLIALSGGADSVLALSFFDKYKRKYKIQICVLHINHSLRGSESDSDEEFCRMLCNKINIEFYSEKIDVSTFAKSEKLSIEEAARNIRYKKLATIQCLRHAHAVAGVQYTPPEGFLGARVKTF